MYVIRFGKLRVIEFADPLEFELHTQRWLAIREAENAYLYMMLADIKHAAAGGARGAGAARLFTIEDNGAIVAAGALPAADTLCMTWATEAMIDVLADHAVQKGWNLRTIYSPEPVSRLMARALAARCGLALEIGRGERVYQLAQVGYRLPEGRLEAATPADLQLLRGWTNHYAAEVAMERTAPEIESALDAIVATNALFLWRRPEVVAMAAWIAPTPQGGCVSWVYVPPERRGKGYGKAVSGALCAHMLASGLKYCFIHTDTHDARSNHIYQAIGATTVCELLRCSLRPSREAGRQMAGV